MLLVLLVLLDSSQLTWDMFLLGGPTIHNAGKGLGSSGSCVPRSSGSRQALGCLRKEVLVLESILGCSQPLIDLAGYVLMVWAAPRGCLGSSQFWGFLAGGVAVYGPF